MTSADGTDRADFDRLFDQYKNCEFSIENHLYQIFKPAIKNMYALDELFDSGNDCRIALCPTHTDCLNVKLFNGKSFNEQFSDITVEWVS